MSVIYVCVLLANIIFTLNIEAESNSLVKACASVDLPCVQESARAFLTLTRSSIPSHGFRGNDPIDMNETTININDGNYLVIQDGVISGLSELKVSSFIVDYVHMSVTWQYIANVTLDTKAFLRSDSDNEFKKSGTFQSKHYLILETKYPVTVIEKDSVDYFRVGNETCDVKVIQEPTVIKASADIEDIIKSIHSNVKTSKQIAEAIGKASIEILVSNLRISSKLVPAHLFLLDYNNTSSKNNI